MKEKLNKLVDNNTSVEVIHHAGDIRGCIFGYISRYGTGTKYIVRNTEDSGCSIIFADDNVTKLVSASEHHTVIYIS
jgi:hypothetical protein